MRAHRPCGREGVPGVTTTTKTGKPRTGLRRRIEDYFQASPDEELSRADMLVKFGCNAKTLDHHLAHMRREGVLVSVHGYRLSSAARMNAARP
jgi:AraC-like DNA-binding protein